MKVIDDFALEQFTQVNREMLAASIIPVSQQRLPDLINQPVTPTMS
jgi:hypothetical protein